MRNFLRSLFGSKKSISKIKPRMQSRRLELLGLEERIVPATITNVAGVITFTLDANSNETLSNLSTLVNGAVININAGSNIGLTGSGLPAGVTIEGSVANQQFVKVDTAVFNTFAGISVIGQASRNDAITIGAGGIDLSAASGAANQLVSILMNQGGTDTLNVNGLVKSKGTGEVNLNVSSGSMTIAGAGDITTTAGNVSLAANSFFTSGDVTTGSGSISFNSALNLSDNIAINSTSGNLSMGIVTAGGKNLIINEGSGSVSIGSLNITTGELSITTTNTGTGANPAIKLATAVFGPNPGIVTAGIINLSAAGDIRVGDHTNLSGVVSAASVNAKSTAGDVIFDNTVTTTQIGGFTSEATLSNKATKIANLVSVGAGANALVTGNLVATADTVPEIRTSGTATISITGKVDGGASTNTLLLTALNGAITIGGAVGGTASTPTLANMFINSNTSLLASGTVNVGTLSVGQATTSTFATSIKFAETVTVANALVLDASSTGTVTFDKTITATGTAAIDLGSVNGAITVTGNITGKNAVSVKASGGGNISVAGITTDQTGAFIQLETGTGNITTSGVISTSGANANIDIDTVTSGNVTINGNVSTSGGGNILLGADTNQGYSATGTGNLTINGTVSTTGSSTSGDIAIGSGGTGTITVNKALSTGTASSNAGSIYLIAVGTQVNTINVSKDVTITSADFVYFRTTGSTNTISFATGANINAANQITDIGSGPGNLVLANNLTTSNDLISFNNVSVSLAGPVSMKAGGQAGNINLGNTNGAQSLTLEATGNIVASSSTAIGGLTPLNSLTVVNSANSVFLDLNSASVVLSDTTGSIGFDGNTVISKSLTTTTEGYSVSFINGKTAVISGAPVFLNTGNVIMQGTTSLPGGATVTGGGSTNANLAGTIVSGGAFNIGSGISSINISDNTQLILNSTSAGSTFASPISLQAQQAGVFKLLGVGTLTLSADSTAGVTTNDSISVINGTLNVTGKLGNASLTSLTSGTITGAGGTIGALTVNTGTVAPGGTLNTGVVTFNAATNYNAAVLNNTTASNLKTSSAINLNGANLALSSIPNGLSVGNVFTIIDNTATQTGINGTFAGLPEGASVSAKDASGNTVAFTISYKGGTNTNDVTLTVASVTPSQTATPQPMVAGEPVLNKFTAVGADAGGGPLVTITFANGTYTSFFAYDPAFRGGVRVALGDVNADGTPEVITGAGPGGGPQVNVYSVNPQTGAVSLQSSFFAFGGSTFTGGVYVAVGRTEGIFGDVIVGAGAGGGPRVQVYAGSGSGLLTSRILNDFYAYSLDFTGGVVVAAGDRLGFVVDEVITAPASNGGWNIKSFLLSGKGNNPEVIEDFFAFNNTTARGGLSLAVGYLNTGRVADLVIGTTNGAFGVIIDSNTSGIVDVPFEGFTGAIRAGVAESSSGLDYAVALAGPTGGPLVSVFAVFSNLRCVDYLFVMNPSFTGGLFGTPTLPSNFR
jgi:fibronectin-binding autotransporter adhesin